MAKLNPCELCEDAWRGLIEAKIILEERLVQMQSNHDSAMRLYAKWRSRAEKAEVALATQPQETT